MILDLIAYVLIGLAAVDWIATYVLARVAWLLRERALTERASVSIILSSIATIVALLAVNRLVHFGLSNEVVSVLLIVSLIGVSLPQIIWLILLVRRGFR